ncbi:MAG TPA: autotransporter-associated beta strand repeat-containing protein, partial [Verrucomicrobiota bacterium]|nr:autotransporter-associated beta strand repeat-containing protein [Verrucomicrobiota bacterium]
MAATSFNSLNLDGSLNLNAGGWVVGGAGNGIVNVFGATGSLSVNSGGVATITAGGLNVQTNASVAVFPGGSLTVGGAVRLGNSGGGSPGSFMTNYGGTVSFGSLTINPGNAASTSQTAPAWRFVILGGVNDLGAVTVQRSPSASGGYNNVPLGSEGLVISNGIVRMTSLDVGGAAGNSWLSTLVAGGSVTNTGAFTVRAITAGRASRFFQNGGLFNSTGGGAVHLRGHTANNSLVWYFVNGGTNLVDGFVVTDPGDTAGTVVLSNSAKIYIGNSGITMGGGNLSANGTNVILTSSGTFGALEDWTGTVPITLAGGTFDAAALDGTPRNITLQGVLRGPSGFTKTGGGVLTLDAANTYTGDTLINAGTLALGLNGSISNSANTIVGSNTVFDVTAVSGGFVVNDARTLGGFGVVTGDVSVASGGRISPGASIGKLTLADNLTVSGSARILLELSSFPAVAASNDLLVVSKDLNASGLNTIEISGPVTVGGVYPLIQYGQNFNGTVGNFEIIGPDGVLSNSVANKTIYLIAQSQVRPAANVAWSGRTSVTGEDVWNTQGVTNWVVESTTQRVTFVPGDSAFFLSNSPAIRTNVTLADTVEPAAVTVDSAASYTLSGSGRISGTGDLTKANTGKLTMLTTNLYT